MGCNLYRMNLTAHTGPTVLYAPRDCTRSLYSEFTELYTTLQTATVKYDANSLSYESRRAWLDGTCARRLRNVQAVQNLLGAAVELDGGENEPARRVHCLADRW